MLYYSKHILYHVWLAQQDLSGLQALNRGARARIKAGSQSAKSQFTSLQLLSNMLHCGTIANFLTFLWYTIV